MEIDMDLEHIFMPMEINIPENTKMIVQTAEEL